MYFLKNIGGTFFKIILYERSSLYREYIKYALSMKTFVIKIRVKLNYCFDN